MGQPTQTTHPWRATVRTLFAAVIGLAALLPAIYSAATGGDSAAATGWAALALTVAGAVTRIMALPGVETFLQKFLPFLSAQPKSDSNP